jgi:hypothetical protein
VHGSSNLGAGFPINVDIVSIGRPITPGLVKIMASDKSRGFCPMHCVQDGSFQSYGFRCLKLKGDSRPSTERRSSIVTRLRRIFWLVVLVSHAMLAFCWLWLEPAGFGLEHPRFWVNQIAPVSGLALTISALLALRFNSAPAQRWRLPLWPSAWAAAAVAGRLLFPDRVGIQQPASVKLAEAQVKNREPRQIVGRRADRPGRSNRFTVPAPALAERRIPALVFPLGRPGTAVLNTLAETRFRTLPREDVFRCGAT